MSSPPIQIQQVLSRACDVVPGWCSPEQMLVLHTLALAVSSLPGDIVEIGSWCGRSAIAFGLAAQLVPPTRVHCIDLFPSRADWKQNPAGDYYLSADIGGRSITGNVRHSVWQSVWLDQIAPIYERWPSTWEAFNESIGAFELTGVVHPHRGSIDTFRDIQRQDFRCKLAYLDGSHDEEDVRKDIRQIEELLVPGGWICFDDSGTSAAGVDAAIRDLILASPHYRNKVQLTRKLLVAQRQ
jgi:predicted O-methyltransferase YrrM